MQSMGLPRIPASSIGTLFFGKSIPLIRTSKPYAQEFTLNGGQLVMVLNGGSDF